MCGLVGAAGDIVGNHERAVKDLLKMDSVRGDDSTGVAFVSKFSKDVTIAKEIGDPFILLNSSKFEKAMAKSHRVILGHNRYATMGGVSKRSAHPFDFDNLVGAHNGTLSSKYRLINSSDFKVDSENLYHHIEERGLQDALNNLHGAGNAWALTWWDKQEETMNFLRNKERPLWMTRTKDNRVLFWASEPWMLYGALGRNQIEHQEVVPLPEDTLYSFQIKEKGEICKPVVKRAAAPVPAVLPPIVMGERPRHIPASTNVHTFPKPSTAPAQEEGNVKKLDTKENVPVLKESADTYLGQKQRKLEILNLKMDKSGSEYFALFDPEHPYEDIRVYFRKTEKLLLIAHAGGDLLGDITSRHPCPEPNKHYYKVNPWNITIVPDDALETYPNSHGVFVTKEEWLKEHCSCSYCSDNLDPTTARFTSEGDALCGSCVKNPEVTQYVNLK